jgi:hypothetical protein
MPAELGEAGAACPHAAAAATTAATMSLAAVILQLRRRISSVLKTNRQLQGYMLIENKGFSAEA